MRSSALRPPSAGSGPDFGRAFDLALRQFELWFLKRAWTEAAGDPAAKQVIGVLKHDTQALMLAIRAKALLESRGYRYDEISLGKHITSSTLRAVSGQGTWPQVFIGGKLIGAGGGIWRAGVCGAGIRP